MDYSILTKLPLFRGVSEQDMAVIFSQLKISETKFDKGDILAMQDEPCNRLIILLSGSVKGEMSDPSGKVVKVEDIEAPSPLAILFLFGAENRFPVQVTSRESVAALVISKQSVLKMLTMNEILLKNYLDISADFASRLSKKLHLMSFRTIRQKAAQYILTLSLKQSSDTVELDRTKSALAEYFGVTRPSLERELTNMQNDGLIMSQGRTVTIMAKRDLMRLVTM